MGLASRTPFLPSPFFLVNMGESGFNDVQVEGTFNQNSDIDLESPLMYIVTMKSIKG